MDDVRQRRLLGWNRQRHDTMSVRFATAVGIKVGIADDGLVNPHGVWTETVLVGVEVHNGLDRP